MRTRCASLQQFPSDAVRGVLQSARILPRLRTHGRPLLDRIDMTNPLKSSVVLFILASALACEKSGHKSSAQPDNAPKAPPATSVVPHDTTVADDGQWLMAAKDYANTRYSALKEITTENASHLQLAWSFSTGIPHGHEAAPLIVGS